MKRFFAHISHRIRVLVRWAAIKVTLVTKFITVDIWKLNLADLKSWHARLVKDAQIILTMLNTFSAQKIGFQATALCYQSTMSVVPFLALAFYLAGGVGLAARLTAFLESNIADDRLLDTLLRAADNILTTAQSGLFGFISMATFLWILIWLMVSVRRVFNNVWKVERESNWFRLIGVAIGILIMSPFVIILFFSGSLIYTRILDLLIPSMAFAENIKSFLGWIIFGVASVLILSLMYKYIPGTRVRYRYALRAAVYAGLAFTVVQYLYLETQVMVTKLNAVYGVIAALPLFMAWLKLGWQVVLYGAELSYAMQDVEKRHITSDELDEFRKAARKERVRYTDASDILEDVNNKTPDRFRSRMREDRPEGTL